MNIITYFSNRRGLYSRLRDVRVKPVSEGPVEDVVVLLKVTIQVRRRFQQPEYVAGVGRPGKDIHFTHSGQILL